MIVTVYVVISQLQIKYFPILNLPSFQCSWSFMVNSGFLIGPPANHLLIRKQQNSSKGGKVGNKITVTVCFRAS